MSREARAQAIVEQLIIPSERRFYAVYAHYQRALKAEQLRRIRELPKGTPLNSFPFALQPWQAAVWQATRKTYATIIRVGIGAGIAEAEATRKAFHGEQTLKRVVKDFTSSPLDVTIPRGYQEAIQGAVETSRARILRALSEQVEETGLDDRDALASRIEGLFSEWRHARDVNVSADQGGGAISYGRNEGHQIAGVELLDWVTAGDERVRETHVTLGNSGSRPQGFDWATLVGGGGPLRFPHDPDVEALELVVNCRCYAPGTIIRGTPQIVSEALYTGPLWRLETARGHGLTVTPNHPVLTARGWLPAHRLREGDDLLSDRLGLDRVTLGVRAPDHEHGEARVEEVFEAFRSRGGLRSAVVGALDFHGDAGGLEQRQIRAAFVDAVLRERFDAHQVERDEHAALVQGRCATAGRAGRPSRTHLLSGGTQLYAVREQDAVDRVAARSAGRPDRQVAARDGVDVLALAVGAHNVGLGQVEPTHVGDPELVRSWAPWLTGAPQGGADTPAGSAEVFAELARAMAGPVAPDKLVRVFIQTACYRGPVYDVQTTSGLVHSAGIITHNCVLLPAEEPGG